MKSTQRLGGLDASGTKGIGQQRCNSLMRVGSLSAVRKGVVVVRLGTTHKQVVVVVSKSSEGHTLS